MLALDTLVYILAPKGTSCHQISTLEAFLVHWLEFGDEGAFRIVGTTKKLAPTAEALHDISTALGTFDLQLLGLLFGQRLGVFTLGIGATGQKFPSWPSFDHHGRATLLALLFAHFRLLAL